MINTKTRLAIIGSGDLGQLIAYHAENNSNYDVVGYFDDSKKKDELTKDNKSILGNTKEDILKLFEQKKFDELIIGIGYKHMRFREAIFQKLVDLIPFANVIHSSSYIDKSCKLGRGIFILPGCVLDKGVELHNNVLLNTGVVIAHDSIIGSHTFLAPSVKLAGYINIGRRCFLGINTTIIDNINIVDDVQTGGGCIVIKSIKSKGLYVGVPSKKIR